MLLLWREKHSRFVFDYSEVGKQAKNNELVIVSGGRIDSVLRDPWVAQRFAAHSVVPDICNIADWPDFLCYAIYQQLY